MTEPASGPEADDGGAATPGRIFQVSGMAPDWSVQADLGPPRTECGVGALMPWAGRLWMISYVAHKAPSGSGVGLYWIDRTLRRRRHPASVDGTYANRFVHYPTSQLVIGPHVIDATHRVRTVEDLVDIRLTATCAHLTDPKRRVYMIGMEGEVFELDLTTLAARQVFDLVEELELPADAQPHFKGACTAHGRLVVTNNTCAEPEWSGRRAAGRLAEYDGERWTILHRKPFYEAYGRGLGGTLYAVGQDHASAILELYAAGAWSTWRLPFGSANYEHLWQHEWPRLREVEHERILADIHGMFYELSPHHRGGRPMPIRPICTHLPAISDFVNWRGLLVAGTNQMTPFGGDNPLAGEPDSGLWIGKTDDLWRWGRPAGWGGPWRDSQVRAQQPSDPFLMTGFAGKCLHLIADDGGSLGVRVEIDCRGDGRWVEYARLDCPSGGYLHHEFPAAFSAHWLRLVPDRDGVATAQLFYT